MHHHFVVQQAQNGLLLRDFLRYSGLSTALLRSVKYAGGFFQNNISVHTNARVATGDVIAFDEPDTRQTAVTAQNLPIDVVYEDEFAMVLHKEAGQTVHPTRGYKDGTLANAFCGLMLKRGEQKTFRPVNRIDRNTSGLVLCALDAYATPLLAKTVHKKYYAIAQGELPLGSGVIDAPIGEEEGSFIKRCVRADGKQSRTEYSVLEVKNGFSLIEAITITGRTHQIRVHFSSIGHPLVGDTLYGGSDLLLPRHALHCGEITFHHVRTGEVVCVCAPLANDMQALWTKLQDTKL